MGTQRIEGTKHRWLSDNLKAVVQEVSVDTDAIRVHLHNVKGVALEGFLDGMKGAVSTKPGGALNISVEGVAEENTLVTIPVTSVIGFRTLLSSIAGGVRDDKPSLHEFYDAIGPKWEQGFWAQP